MSVNKQFVCLFVCLLRSPLATAKAVAILPGVYRLQHKKYS